MAALYWSDNGDATGGIALIQGSVAGDTHEMWVSRYAGGTGNDIYESAGVISGDGSLAVTLEPGPYHGFLATTNAGAITYSAPVGFRVWDESQLSLHERCAYAIRDFVLGLSLPGVPDDDGLHCVTKVGAKLETVVRQADPKAAVYYIPSSETYFRLDNSHDTVRLPVVVALFRQSSQTLKKGFSEVLWYRELMHRAHSACGARGLGLPEVHTIELQPGAVIDPGRWLQDYDASIMTFTCVSEQQAGLV